MRKLLLFTPLLFACLFAVAQDQKETTEPPFRRYFIGSSAFMLANFSSNTPDFYQLNAGYWLTKKDVISIEAITWKYKAPLGIPYGDSYMKESENYKGYVRSVGIALAYQRFWYKGLYSALHGANLLQNYMDEKGKKIQSGYQLFTTFRTGYHFTFGNNRYFIEPNIAFTAWPINTNVPESFKKADKKWNSFFLFEPGLHLGVKF
jgi:hypothetical protein